MSTSQRLTRRSSGVGRNFAPHNLKNQSVFLDIGSTSANIRYPTARDTNLRRLTQASTDPSPITRTSREDDPGQPALSCQTASKSILQPSSMYRFCGI
jgi:hypothetical protein